LGKPLIGIGFRYDSKHFHARPGHVVENANFTNAKTILGLPKAAQSLDSTLAHPLRLMAKMFLHRLLDRAAIHRPK
jgi:hypothetical protein